MTKYEKTKDPNIIRQTESVQSEIHLDKLEAQIKALEAQLITKPIEKADYPPDVCKLIDLHNARFPIRQDVEAELTERRELLGMLRKL